jgi:hypothetical protein
MNMTERVHFAILLTAVAACSGAPEATSPSDQIGATSQSLDCKAFDGYTAALASYTVDCLGTIGPQSFKVDEAGHLRRAFGRCTQDDSKRQSIDDILGLQYREGLFPHATECIAGRWAEWKSSFDRSDVVECPRWRKDGVVNAPTRERMSRIVGEFPATERRHGPVRVAGPVANGATFGGLAEQNHAFTVSFPAGAPTQSCGTPAACAARCAGGFAGFVLQAEGAKVLGDPTYWLADDVYDDMDTDPFWADGYFHPMSYFGPVPGVIAGHRARSYLDEQCSYFDGTLHVILNLRINCLDNADLDSCISLCLPEGDPRLTF